MDRSGRGPQFAVNDVLPYVRVPPGETAVALEQLAISVRVSGLFAETTQTLTFRNPNRRPLEGNLVFPLPDGAVVCGYAIDLEGELVEGVIVAKQEARRILEAEIRKGIDPGLVEQVQGNVYRTRIYPLPAGGTRTVRLTYVTDLAIDGTSAAYHLPLGHASAIDKVSLRVEVAKGEVVPQLSGGLGNLTLASLAHSYVAEATLPRGVACDDLLVRLPDLPRHLRSVERCGDDTFFAVSSAIPETTASAWSPRRIALLWDASGSRTDVDRELELVAALVDQWPQLVIDVRVLRDVVDSETRTFSGKGERDALIGYLRSAPRDGGTNFAALDLSALPHAGDEAWLVFSDGLGTVGRGLPKPSNVPVIAVSSAASTDSAFLRHLASRSGGVHVDLMRTPVDAALKLVARAHDSLHVTGAEGCADLHVRQGARRFTVVGRLTADMGQLRLDGGGAPSDHISIPRAMATTGGLVARAWAGQQARTLALADAEQATILELARRHGVVTADSSLLVLESLEQHLEYDIEPAASRPKLREQFRDQRARKQREERATKLSHIDHVVELWKARVQWWETVHTPRVEEVDTRKKKGMTRAAAYSMEPMDLELGSPAGAAMDSMMAEDLAPSGATMSASLGAPAPSPGPPPAMAAAPAPGVAPVADKKEAAPSAQGSIQIKPWTPDTPYLTKLRASSDPYAAYITERSEYASSPAFFLDCGDFFLGRGDRALGLRVLSNLVELGLDDAALMRMYAWRLQQATELDGAIDLFERVRKTRDDEPQSHRDLALALGERWERTGDATDATRAMDLLYDVIEKAWERFPEIELIALMELNRLIAKSAERGVATPARIDRRLVRLLDLDLRISMSWDLDLTDVDLHVFEPNGEHAYYGQNQSSGGGLVSRDFRQGYGPEEYVRRVAQPGKYVIKAHYYGSQQQDIAGACTVIVHVMLNYGRPSEQRQVLTLRLDQPSSQVTVGEVTFAGAPQPEDWRPRFKKLKRGMTLDEISNVVGSPTRVEGSDQTVLVYELAGGVIVHVVAGPRLVAVKQIMDGAALDLL